MCLTTVSVFDAAHALVSNSLCYLQHRLACRRAVPATPSMNRYGSLGLLGLLCTRGHHLTPSMRTDHPHCGAGWAHVTNAVFNHRLAPAGPRAGLMPWEALSAATCPLPPPWLTCCQSAVTSLNWTIGSVYLSSFASGPRGGVVFDGGGAMLAAAASSPCTPQLQHSTGA